jgi:hypothetical protein
MEHRCQLHQRLVGLRTDPPRGRVQLGLAGTGAQHRGQSIRGLLLQLVPADDPLPQLQRQQGLPLLRRHRPR